MAAAAAPSSPDRNAGVTPKGRAKTSTYTRLGHHEQVKSPAQPDLSYGTIGCGVR